VEAKVISAVFFPSLIKTTCMPQRVLTHLPKLIALASIHVLIAAFVMSFLLTYVYVYILSSSALLRKQIDFRITWKLTSAIQPPFENKYPYLNEIKLLISNGVSGSLRT
jgi:hypothetical protein